MSCVRAPMFFAAACSFGRSCVDAFAGDGGRGRAARRLGLAAGACPAFDRGRALDDLLRASRRPRRPWPAGSRSRRRALPAARMSSKSPSLFTLCGANSVMSTSPAQSSRCLISSHDRSPLPPGIAAARAHQHPRAFQLVAVERELQVALLQRRVHVVGLRRPRALVPQHDDAGAVALGDHALERAVLDRMILDVHREPLGLRIERRPLRHRPRQQHAVVLEAEVVVQVAGEVLLHAEEQCLAPASASSRARPRA